MQIYILDRNRQIVGVVDESESVLWQKKYNDVGMSEIYIPCSETYLDLLQRGNYLYRYDDDMTCKIESVEITTDAENGDYIIATAKDICTILSGRIIRWQIVYSGTVAGFVEKLLNDNIINPAQAQRRIPRFEIDKSNFSQLTAKIEVSAFTDDLLQVIVTACKAANYGFRLSYNIEDDKYIFKLYKGADKATGQGAEYIEFSPQFANILSSNYKTDESNFKNVVYVGYEDEAEQMHLLSMFSGDTEPQGEERREIFVDGSGTSRDITLDELRQIFPSVSKSGNTYYATIDGKQKAVATSEGEGEEEEITITDYTYLLLIRSIGQNALAEHTKTQTFTGDVDTLDTYEYRVDYNLGDIVKIINEYGIEAEAQITEIMESDDTENGYQIEPKFEYLS